MALILVSLFVLLNLMSNAIADKLNGNLIEP